MNLFLWFMFWLYLIISLLCLLTLAIGDMPMTITWGPAKFCAKLVVSTTITLWAAYLLWGPK